MMEQQKPQWTITEQSVLALTSEMHNHFRNLQSHYKVIKGDLLSQIESASEQTKIKDLENQLREVEEKLILFHVLNNSISSVDVVLHTPKMIAEFKK